MPVSIDPAKRNSRQRSPSQIVRRGSPGRPQETGDSPIKVKGQRATAKQRDVISACLQEAARLGASRRVMMAVVMCITQESNAGIDAGATGPGGKDKGIFQQDRSFISAENANDPVKATRAFLLGGDAGVGGNEPSKKGWKDWFGSLKNAPGSLTDLIAKVQAPAAQYRSAYAQWEAEAGRTVDAFLGGNLPASSRSYSPTEHTTTYLFERGTRDKENASGSNESSWDAIGRLAEEVGFRRWAALNTLWYVSDDELSAAAASIQVHGDEGWLLAPPAYEWAADRSTSEVTLRVLTERWGVLPGAVVYLVGQGPIQGRYLVAGVRDDLWSPESEVTLRRPVQDRPEPAAEKVTSSSTSTPEAGTPSNGINPNADAATRLKQACEQISQQHRAYSYGGGHGKPLSQIGPNDPLDCSSSVSLALYKAGLFGDRKNAIVSGEFASSWGKAGKGDGFTVYANKTHVWIEFADGSRFDTSPHGDGESGARVRSKPRNDQDRFTARHAG